MGRPLPDFNLWEGDADEDRIVCGRIAVLLLAFLPGALGACGFSSPRGEVDEQLVRPPTPDERRRISSSVRAIWAYESRPPDNLAYSYGVRPRPPRVRPTVVRVRISRADPRYASAVLGLPEAGTRRRRGTAVIVLRRDKETSFGRWGPPVAGPALDFPLSCGAATPKALRALLCPSPWRVLAYPRPRIHAQTTYVQTIRTRHLRAVDWRRVTLPGGVCGSSRPIRRRMYRYGPAALIHADVDHVWWNPVVVSSWSKPRFGDLDGDGRDEAALRVVCSNGGGMAAGQLAFSAVIFKNVRRSLRVLGILSPRQPLSPLTSHVPLNDVTKIERGRITVAEAWYGPYDGTCCSSGRAVTTWEYQGAELRPARTRIVQRPWSSPLAISELLVDPGYYGISAREVARIAATPDLRFTVAVENYGRTVRRDVRVTLAIAQRPSPVVRTKTIRRVAPWPLHPPTVSFGDLGRLQLGRTAVTVRIHAPGTNPVRYRVVFTRG